MKVRFRLLRKVCKSPAVIIPENNQLEHWKPRTRLRAADISVRPEPTFAWNMATGG